MTEMVFSPALRRSSVSRVASTGLSRQTQSLIAKMRAADWLSGYGTLEGQALTFQRVSRMTPAVAKLIGAEEEIVRRDSELDACFLSFYPDLRGRVSQWLSESD